MMENGSEIAAAQGWNDTLKFFRALGGVAENIRPKNDGRGLVAVDPAKPVELSAPAELLFDVNDLEYVGGHIRLKPTANVMDAQRLFFERYHDTMSWGRFGRTQNAAFIAALDSLPDEVRTVLIEDFECEDLFEGDSAIRALRQFLKSTSIRRGDVTYLFPLLDLANHDAAGMSCQAEGNAVCVRGYAPGEVFIANGVHDALSSFRIFGIAKREPGAFSLPVSVTPRPPEILVGRDMSRLLRHGKTWVPEMNTVEGSIGLSCLMIGHDRFPKLSRGIFRSLMREAGYVDPDDAFDRILNYNWTRYLNLLEVLEPHQGEMVSTLRRMARFQLETMSHCVGSRELDTVPRARDRDDERRPPEQRWEISIQ